MSVKIKTTAKSIVVMHSGEVIAEYASKAPKSDAASMRRTIRRHLDNGGTVYNYQW
jgi:hypothetical protein